MTLDQTDEYRQANLDLWNAWTLIHEKSNFYDLQGFKAGNSTLRPIEVTELGDVRGRSLLHLQCHFGLDTVSWARMGANVTGVDFSDKAIALASRLARELGIPATFVCSDVYDLPRVLAGPYDIVFASYGVLCWLHDLTCWAQVAAHFLGPGGTFYMVELHPFASVFDDAEGLQSLNVAYPYFGSTEPMRCEEKGSYADPDADYRAVSYQWSHSISEVLGALISAGLQIEFLHEFPYCCYRMLPCREQGEDGWWRLKEHADAVPLMFSLRATRQ